MRDRYGALLGEVKKMEQIDGKFHLYGKIQFFGIFGGYRKKIVEKFILKSEIGFFLFQNTYINYSKVKKSTKIPFKWSKFNNKNKKHSNLMRFC